MQNTTTAQVKEVPYLLVLWMFYVGFALQFYRKKKLYYFRVSQLAMTTRCNICLGPIWWVGLNRLRWVLKHWIRLTC